MPLYHSREKEEEKMAGVNKVIVLGNLGRDPELHTTESGSQVCRLNVATTRTWNNRQTNERQQETEWHRITVWGSQADSCSKFLSKGRQVYVEGRLKTSSYNDKEGNKRYSTEIIAESVQFVGNKNDGPQQNVNGQAQGSAPANQYQPEVPQEDDIPF